MSDPGHHIGTQKKYEEARDLRQKRRQSYVHSSTYRRRGGYRYLTDRELDEWYARLDRVLGKKVKVPK